MISSLSRADLVFLVISSASRDGPLPGVGGRKKASCSFNVRTCFGTWFENEDETISASDMFKRIAFGGDGVCGDCSESTLLAFFSENHRRSDAFVSSFSLVFTALISASGVAGLSAVLPSPDDHLVLPQSHIPTSPSSNPNLINLQPHMPLTRTWKDTDFSLPSVVALTNPSDPLSAINLRTFSLQLIARYQWVSASTNALFTMCVRLSRRVLVRSFLEADRSSFRSLPFLSGSSIPKASENSSRRSRRTRTSCRSRRM